MKLSLSTFRLFILWLLIVPPGLFYLITYYPPKDYNLIAIMLFMLLGFFTVYFPIMRNDKAIFLAMWITVPVFVTYGLIIEIIVMQVSILAILLTHTTRVSKLNRMLYNSLLFYILSVVSASAFYFAGGEIGSLEFWPILLAVFAYQFVHTLLNDLVINLFIRDAKNNSLFFTKDIGMNMVKVVVMVPFMLTLYFLFQYVGVGAMFLIAIPYFFITILGRLNNNTAKINADLQVASELGQSFSAHLTVENVIDEFMIKVTHMLSADYGFLYNYKNNRLKLIRSYIENEFVPLLVPEYIERGEGISGNVLLNNEPVIFDHREQWKSQVTKFTKSGMESVVCIPIIRNKKTVGVLLLGSNEKKAFLNYQLQILDLICSYFSVAIEKARYLESVVIQMEYCALTKLHNYRYLNKELESNMTLVKKGKLNKLSVVLLDIDFFKKVNDSYGHQSGNDILSMMATILKENLPEDAVVARYGGEEFVYLLPNFNKDEAFSFAEKIRRIIEQATFKITPDLDMKKQQIDVQITISAGVSTALQDTDETSALLRNADRALYIGAKQQGRNRVAEYVK